MLQAAFPMNSFTALRAIALRETIAEFEATGSPVITDGEQTKPSFATYPLAGLANLAADGVVIPSLMDTLGNFRGWRRGPFATALVRCPF